MKEMMRPIHLIKYLIIGLIWVAGYQSHAAVCNISGSVKQSGQIKPNHPVFLKGQNVDTVIYTNYNGQYNASFQAFNDFETFEVSTLDCIRDTSVRTFEYQTGITNYYKNFDLCPSNNRVTISGTVLNNGTPAEGIVVSFYVNQTYKLIGNAVTGKDGTYQETFSTGDHKSGVVFSKMTNCYGDIVMQNWLFEIHDSLQIDYESCKVDPFPFIGGRILKNGLPVYAGEVDVHLYRYESSTKSIQWEASQVVTHGGSYFFSIKNPGKFLVKAVPSSSYHQMLPEYFGDVSYWDQAHLITIDRNPEPELDIQLDEFELSNGNSEINGIVKYYPIQQPGSPMSHVPVLLLNNMQQPISFTKSSADGTFSFGELTSGQYYLIFDQVGIPYHPYPVTVEKSGTSVNGVELVVTPLGSGLNGALSDESVVEEEKNIRVYPNPTQGKLRLSLKGYTEVSGALYHLNGQMMMEIEPFSGESYELDLSGIENGVYWIKLKDRDDQEEIYKVIKN